MHAPNLKKDESSNGNKSAMDSTFITHCGALYGVDFDRNLS